MNNIIIEKEPEEYCRDECINLDRIYDIACDPQVLTENEKAHLRFCGCCRKNLELAMLFQGAVDADAMLEDENDEQKNKDLQFSAHPPFAKDEQYSELLLAGAPAKELTNFDMAYEASKLKKQHEDYWKAVLTVSLGKEYNIVNNGKLIERVKIDFSVRSGNNRPLSGKLKIFNQDIKIVDGSSVAMNNDIPEPTSIIMTKDTFMDWGLHPAPDGECFFQRPARRRQIGSF